MSTASAWRGPADEISASSPKTPDDRVALCHQTPGCLRLPGTLSILGAGAAIRDAGWYDGSIPWVFTVRLGTREPISPRQKAKATLLQHWVKPMTRSVKRSGYCRSPGLRYRMRGEFLHQSLHIKLNPSEAGHLTPANTRECVDTRTFPSNPVVTGYSVKTPRGRGRCNCRSPLASVT